MGEHNGNPLAIAKKAGMGMPPKNAPPIRVQPIGDDYVIGGWGIDAQPDGDGDICAVLTLMAGKASPIAGVKLGTFPVHVLGKISVERVKELVDKALMPNTEETEDKPA